MRKRNVRNRTQQRKTETNGKIFIQVIICITIICSFIILKDMSLPNGKTPREYAQQILTTTVNIPELVAKFSDDNVLPAGAEIVKP